jgi:hypothetical protein
MNVGAASPTLRSAAYAVALDNSITLPRITTADHHEDVFTGCSPRIYQAYRRREAHNGHNSRLGGERPA